METKSLNLRQFTADDLDMLCVLHCDPEISKTNLDGTQTKETVAKHLGDFLAHQEKHGFSQMAIFEKSSGEFIGRCGLSHRILNHEIGQQIEIRIALLPKFWKRGYGKELTALLLEFAFEDLKLDFLAASILATNIKSINLITKSGFKFIKDIKPCYGVFDSIGYYLITKDEYFSKKS